MPKVISLIFFFIYFNLSFASEKFSLALITNQESNKVDVIDLIQKKKIKEIIVGKRPAGISLDEKNKKVYVSNPEGDSVTEIDLSNFSKQNISSGSSHLGIFFSVFNESIYVSNWYDNKLSIINNNFKKDIQIVEVGNSPAGIFVSQSSKDIFVANREDNNLYVIDAEEFKILDALSTVP